MQPQSLLLQPSNDRVLKQLRQYTTGLNTVVSRLNYTAQGVGKFEKTARCTFQNGVSRVKGRQRSPEAALQIADNPTSCKFYIGFIQKPWACMGMIAMKATRRDLWWTLRRQEQILRINPRSVNAGFSAANKHFDARHRAAQLAPNIDNNNNNYNN